MKEKLLAHKRPIIYMIVGGINTAVDIAVFHLLYLFSPLSVALCNVIGYMSGILCSFLLNRGVTFKDGKNQKIPKQALRFLVVNGLSLGIGTLGVHFLYLAGLNATVAKGMITVLTAIINYFGYKLFVFEVEDDTKEV